MVKYGKSIKDKNMCNVKAFTVYVCQSHAWRSMFIDSDPHTLACDNPKMEHMSSIAYSILE
jgi:hypothetical protein